MAVDFLKKTVSLRKDPSGAPATDLNTVGDDDLRKAAQKVQLALSMLGLAGLRCQVRMVLDLSGSMFNDLSSGRIYQLVKWALAVALVIDGDGKVPIRGFDHRLFPEVVATKDNWRTILDEVWTIRDPYQMGSTVMSAPLEELVACSEAEEDLLITFFVGDGDPNRNDVVATKRAAYNSAGYPIWILFLSLRQVALLEQLNKAGDDVRLLDNIAHVDTPPSLLDGLDNGTFSLLDFAKLMFAELPGFLIEATRKGSVT